MTQIAVFGAGSWGTAFASILAAGDNDVRVWGRRQGLVDQLNAGVNDDYLPGVALPSRISASTDPAEVTDGADIVVLSVPSQSLRDNLTGWAPLLGQDKIVVSLMKGIELGTTKRMSQVIHEVAGIPAERIAVVSGPNLAREIVQQQPAATVVACPDVDAATSVAAACSTSCWSRAMRLFLAAASDEISTAFASASAMIWARRCSPSASSSSTCSTPTASCACTSGTASSPPW
mgnify:CR=1 FL=1